jgi:hypothetical protein
MERWYKAIGRLLKWEGLALLATISVTFIFSGIIYFDVMVAGIVYDYLIFVHYALMVLGISVLIILLLTSDLRGRTTAAIMIFGIMIPVGFGIIAMIFTVGGNTVIFGESYYG